MERLLPGTRFDGSVSTITNDLERRERSVRIGKLGFHQLTSPVTTDPARIPVLSGNLKKISICFRRSLGNHRILTQICVLQLIPNANDLNNSIFLGRGIDDVNGALPRGEPLGTAVNGAYSRLSVIINTHPITWTTPPNSPPHGRLRNGSR